MNDRARRMTAMLCVLTLLGAGCSKGDAADAGAASDGSGGSRSGGSGGSSGSGGGSGSSGSSAGDDDGAAGARGGTGGRGSTSGGSGADDAGAIDAAIDGSEPDAAIDAGEPLDHACLDDITGYASTGPFAFETATVGSVKMWLPSVPSGCHVPVVSFANGTAATCSNYVASFEHLASHGFAIACYETGQTGDGTDCEEAIASAFEAYPELVDRRVGIGGHVQGGGSAAVCVQRAEERWGQTVRFAGLGIQPEHGWGGMGEDYPERYAQIRSPMFVFHGTEAGEGAAQWVGDGFALLDPETEAYWYAAVGAPYLPIPTEWINEAAVAWFRWQLLDDQAACRYFVEAMPDSAAWDIEATHSARECMP